MAELSVSDRPPVRVVEIDGEARMNVLSRALVAELSAEAKRAAADAGVRAVVLSQRGTAASSTSRWNMERGERRWLYRHAHSFR